MNIKLFCTFIIYGFVVGNFLLNIFKDFRREKANDRAVGAVTSVLVFGTQLALIYGATH
jgi:hypothetical protein